MKERLTGAIILVVLIVLLVPELLSGPKGPSAPVPAGTAATSAEEPPLRSYTINLGDDSHSRGESAESSGPAMPQPSGPEQPTVQPGTPTSDTSKAQSEQPVATGSPTASSQAPKPQPPGKPQASSTPQSSGAPQTSGASQPSSTRQTPSGQAARSGEGAAPPQRTVKATAPAQKPTPPAPAAAPRSESGWAVQLGVFASRENAERLALDVRVKGFKASVSPVTSGSRKLYRVRVGPTPDRAAAQELQGRLKAAGRPGGTVVPYS